MDTVLTGNWKKNNIKIDIQYGNVENHKDRMKIEEDREDCRKYSVEKDTNFEFIICSLFAKIRGKVGLLCHLWCSTVQGLQLITMDNNRSGQ